MPSRLLDGQTIDKIEIRAVLEKYFHGVDTKNLELILDCFTEDVNASYLDGAFDISGRAEMVKFLNSPVPFEAHLHSIAHASITVNGEFATADSFALARLVPGKVGENVLMRALRYLDKLRFQDGEWRIYRREHLSLWQAAATEVAIRSPMVTETV